MIAVVCVGDGGGMLFNKRRVSRDKKMIEDFAKLSADGVVFISEISEGLFENSEISLVLASNPLEAADDGDYAFVEDKSLAEFKGKIKTLIIYKWNREYPSDFSLDLDPVYEKMRLSEIYEFQGKAHEKITRERWER